MFATLLGALPRPDGRRDRPDVGILDDQVREAIRAQDTAGLEPITDGRLRDPEFEQLSTRLIARAAGLERGGPRDALATVEAWRFAAAQTERAVKQALPGPYSVGRRAARDGADLEAATLGAAAALREEVDALAAAGCPLVEIEEVDAHLIGTDEMERVRFRRAHRRLVEGVAGTHLSLSIVGGSGWGAGLETILDAPYSSLAVDLIEGPDNWNLVTRLRGDRGVVAGVLPAKDSPADAKELLLWAARYAATTNRRGLDRVGLGSAGSWANLAWEAAVARMHRLGEAARLAVMPPGDDLARRLDPRAINARTAALGHDAPRPPRPPRGRCGKR